MIAPRTTRLIRAGSLRAWQQAIAETCPDDPAGALPTLVIVPTRSAARVLQRTLADLPGGGRHAPRAGCDIRTRGGMYERLLQALVPTPEWLTAYEREALLERGAHAAITDGLAPPFNLRPALVAEMLGLYDELLRFRQSVDDFERLVEGELEAQAATDRGAERLLRQTRFLVASFRFYQREVRGRHALDEHALRARVLSEAGASPWRQVVVTVGDRAAGPGGLWPADFDLLTRIDGLDRIDVIATEALLASGFHTRIHELLPGIEEVRHESTGSDISSPRLLVPPGGERRAFVSRDREEELADAIRRMPVSAETAGDEDRPALDRTAIVFARPLPYLYLAGEVFASADIPFQCDDALPLAAEPVAAAVDLVLTFVSSDASSESTIAMLRSPHIVFTPDCPAIEWTASVAALEGVLLECGDSAGADRLDPLALDLAVEPDVQTDRGSRRRRKAADAARAAASAAAELAALFGRAPAAEQLEALQRFLDAHRSPESALGEREVRAHGAIRAILEGLIGAMRGQPAITWEVHQLAAAVRRWMEAHTFEPRRGHDGVHLLDAVAARYGSFDDVHLVGLIEGEWPERRRRNIFYSPFLLRRLGWQDEGARQADRASFFDLLRLARHRTAVSTIQLEDEALAEPSSFLDELHAADLETATVTPADRRIFVHEALLAHDVEGHTLSDTARRWLAVRRQRHDLHLPIFHGQGLPWTRAEYGVGSVELYRQCPFKYFARYVLELEEETIDTEGLSPRDRGVFVHAVLQAFFERWQSSGRGAIVPGTLDEALAEMEAIAEPMLARLGPVDAALERARLFGSAAGPGIGDLVLRMEAERPVAVLGRRLEERFSGAFDLNAVDGRRRVPVRGVVDRIDVLADGSVRVLDYKSLVPQSPLQLAIYAVTAVQRLGLEQGRTWRVGEAAYVVYGGKREIRTLAGRGRDLAESLSDAEARFVSAIDAMAAGAFPARPIQTRLCASCAYDGVCRKDYVDEAESVPDAPAV